MRPTRVLLLAVLLAAGMAAAWSAFWWHRGFVPSVLDDVNLWGLWRQRADANPHVLALAGSSRLLMGLDLPTLRARIPDKQIIQLSVNGGTPLAILQNLADDDRFLGSVLCEILPQQAYMEQPWGEAWPGYENLSLSQRLEAPLHVALARKTNFFLPDLALLNVLRELARHRRLVTPSFFQIDSDRQGRLNFARLAPTDLDYSREINRISYAGQGHALTGADFAQRIAEVRRLAEKIRARGGSVLFFRMVSSSPVSETHAARFPDAVYWDVFRQEVGFPCLNYAEIPALMRFPCPDGAHLDQSEQPAFTAALMDVIIGEHLLR